MAPKQVYFFAAALAALTGFAAAQPFQLPTANRAIYERGGDERFFVGTTGKSWESGTFGGVRSGGTAAAVARQRL